MKKYIVTRSLYLGRVISKGDIIFSDGKCYKHNGEVFDIPSLYSFEGALKSLAPAPGVFAKIKSFFAKKPAADTLVEGAWGEKRMIGKIISGGGKIPPKVEWEERPRIESAFLHNRAEWETHQTELVQNYEKDLEEMCKDVEWGPPSTADAETEDKELSTIYVEGPT